MKLTGAWSLVSLFLIFSCNDNKKQGSEKNTLPATEIEKIRLSDLNGASLDMKQFKGKTVFVNFWATWCKPCIEEMPTIKNVKESLRGQAIEFLFASDDTIDEIKNFEKEHNYQLNYVNANNIEELGIVGLPTTLIFDKNGKQVFSEMGYRKWDDNANLALLLKIAKQE